MPSPGSLSTNDEDSICSIIIDPESKEELTDAMKIKDTILNYCKHILSNRDPKPKFQKDLEIKWRLYISRMSEEVEDD